MKPVALSLCSALDGWLEECQEPKRRSAVLSVRVVDKSKQKQDPESRNVNNQELEQGLDFRKQPTHQNKLSSDILKKARAAAFCSAEWELEKLMLNFFERCSMMNCESPMSTPFKVIQGVFPLGPNS